ncbi:MAG TPA: hypothetical protein VG096_26835 [Bryobacteraceae bacterium]|jgi:hypothetical protein|nr:hypothetical protein [Bryobacteraceae bacterium]
MISFALILLAAASHVEVVNEVYRVPPGEWRSVELSLKQRPAMVSVDFKLESGSPRVRLALMRREDLARFRGESPTGVMAATTPGASGRIRYRVRTPGDYVVVIDNRGGDARPAEARLRVALDFELQSGPEVTLLSPGRQFAVILISFAVFFGIVSYSARRLLRGIRH